MAPSSAPLAAPPLRSSNGSPPRKKRAACSPTPTCGCAVQKTSGPSATAPSSRTRSITSPLRPPASSPNGKAGNAPRILSACCTVNQPDPFLSTSSANSVRLAATTRSPKCSASSSPVSGRGLPGAGSTSSNYPRGRAASRSVSTGPGSCCSPAISATSRRKSPIASPTPITKQVIIFSARVISPRIFL